jgi:hypothetical protein
MHALTLTPAAQRWLTHTQHARSLNVFERACNLVNERGEVLALVTAARAMVPFGLQVDGAGFGEVSPADSVGVAGDELRLGPLRIFTGAASVWNPVPDWEAISRALAADPRRQTYLAETVIALGKPGSLLDLLSPSPGGRGGWGVRAERGARSLIAGLHTQSPDQCLAGVHALAGLGGGLTPAGDDFICGALFAAWAGLLPSPSGRGAGGEGELVAQIADHAASRTTTLSAACLRAAARGECMALWHSLFEALRSSDASALRSAVESLLAVGHTSGADALAGFIAAYHWHVPVPAHHL